MISPMFGAMLMTTILNSGTSLVPRIVNQVTTSNGQIIYKGKKEDYKTCITEKGLLNMTGSPGLAKKKPEKKRWWLPLLWVTKNISEPGPVPMPG
jgi:hypothetical protein